MKNFLTVYGGAFATAVIAYLGSHVMPGSMSWSAWQPYVIAALVFGLQAAWSRYHLTQPVPPSGAS